jgi:RNA polymerase sigma factor (sigma-70 family)
VDDIDAIRRCQGGDIDGLDPLVERYQAGALRLAYLLTGDRNLAEDIAQDGFIQAFQRMRRFELGRPFAPWLYRIITNIARARLRSRRRLREVWLNGAFPAAESDEEPAADDAHVTHALHTFANDPHARVEQAEARSAILDALDALTQKQREAIILRYYLGCNDRECAAIAGCGEGAFRVRLHDGLKALKRVIQSRYRWLMPIDTPTTDSWETTRHVAYEQ